MATPMDTLGSLPAQKGRLVRVSEYFTLDSLITFLAQAEDRPFILSCSRTTDTKVEWEYFTATELDRFAEHAARFLEDSGLKPKHAPQIVALLGRSDLDYVVCMLALSRLGYIPFLLSSTLSLGALIGLCSKERATTMVLGRASDAPREIVGAIVGRVLDAPKREEYDKPDPNTRRYSPRNPTLDGLDKTLIMHSSGTSGEPRPIHWTRKRFTSLFALPLGLSLYGTVPLYHTHGLTMMFQSFSGKKVYYLHDQSVEMSPTSLFTSISAADPQTIFTVPFALKMLAETEEGIELLVSRRMVSWAGTRLPDELGDMLVERGVHLGTVFGSTETGLLLESLTRPRGDPKWSYLQIPPHVKPFIHMKPEQNNTYECVVLPGYESLDISNSNQPPGSYHTGDLFEPNLDHTKWKYVARKDDRFTLSNGQHIHPLPIEGFVKQSPHVKEAVVFGAGRPVPGILIFRASEDPYDLKPGEKEKESRPSSSGKLTRRNTLSTKNFDFISFYDDFVLPGSRKSEPCVVIPPECTLVFDPEQAYAVTDKGSVKRGIILDAWKGRIDQAYRDYLSRV